MFSKDMFNDLFDFGKTRTLAQSFGFYIFYGALFFGVTGLFRLLSH
jgi:hypothetical protein